VDWISINGKIAVDSVLTAGKPPRRFCRVGLHPWSAVTRAAVSQLEIS